MDSLIPAAARALAVAGIGADEIDLIVVDGNPLEDIKTLYAGGTSALKTAWVNASRARVAGSADPRIVAGRQGFEPRYADPESAVLPLDDLPTKFIF